MTKLLNAHRNHIVRRVIAATFADREERLERQVTAVLAAITTVERLAAEWPEGYAYFPHASAPATNLPAVRIEDLNARLAAAREAA